jgi:hypothetical protein
MSSPSRPASYRFDVPISLETHPFRFTLEIISGLGAKERTIRNEAIRKKEGARDRAKHAFRSFRDSF